MKKILLLLSLLAIIVPASGQTQTTRRGIKNRTTGTIHRPSTSTTTTGTTTTSTSSSREKDINNGIRNRASYDTKDALVKTPLQDAAAPSVIVNNRGEAFVITPSTKNINDTPGAEMFAADQSTIFPGAIVYANKDLADGRPTLVGLPYGTVDIEIDFNNGAQTRKTGVKNDRASVMSAIYSLLNSGNAGYAAPVNFNAQETSTSSMSKMCLELGMDAKYMQNQVKVDTKTTSSESKIIKVQDFTQKFYTVMVTPYADDEKYKYFGSNVTWSQISAKLQYPLAMINSVTYGRRAYYFEEYKTSDFSFTGSQSANVSVGAASIKATSAQDITENSKSSKVWMYMLGGSDQPARDVLNGVAVRTAFGKEGQLKVGSNNQGIPIAFTAVFLASGRSIQAKATGSYTELGYTKCPKTVRWEIHNRANTVSDGIKFKAMYNVIAVSGNAQSGYSYRIIKGGGSGEDGYADYIENKYSNKTQKTRTMPTSDIEKKGVKMENCYVLGPVYYTIRAHTAAGQKWHQDEAGFFDITSGSMKVYMNGSALAGGKGVYIHSETNPKPIGKR